jgi:transposase
MAKKARVFSPQTKLAVVKRMLSGEEVSALARELKVSRTFLYRWKARFREGGAAALQLRRGRPPKSRSKVAELRPKPVEALDAAQRRIWELERKIGQQQLELDFFRQALRQVGATRRPIDGSGAKRSTPVSRR